MPEVRNNSNAQDSTARAMTSSDSTHSASQKRAKSFNILTSPGSSRNNSAGPSPPAPTSANVQADPKAARRRNYKNIELIKGIACSNYYVYEGKSINNDMVVAVKIMTRAHTRHETEIAGFAVQEFMMCREILMGLLVDHRNIAQVFDYEVNNDQIAIIMEKAPGKALDHFINDMENQLLPEETGRWIAWEILDALIYLHTNNILHGDIKPANVMVSSTENRVTLVDLGVTQKYSIKGEENIGVPQGTGHYMCPEMMYNCDNPYDYVLGGEEIDMWSFGCLLFEVVYNIHPFHGLPMSSGDPSENISSTYRNFFKKYEGNLNLEVLLMDAYKAAKIETSTEMVRQRLDSRTKEINELLALLLQVDRDKRINDPNTKMTLRDIAKHSWFSKYGYDDGEIAPVSGFPHDILAVDVIDQDPYSQFSLYGNTLRDPKFAPILQARRLNTYQSDNDSIFGIETGFLSDYQSSIVVFHRVTNRAAATTTFDLLGLGEDEEMDEEDSQAQTRSIGDLAGYSADAAIQIPRKGLMLNLLGGDVATKPVTNAIIVGSATKVVQESTQQEPGVSKRRDSGISLKSVKMVVSKKAKKFSQKIVEFFKKLVKKCKVERK